MELKTCSKCEEAKPKDQFHKHRRGKDGLQSWCKACFREAKTVWREANREKHREGNARYRERYRDKENARHREYYVENRDAVLARAAARWAEPENIDRLREAGRRWREANPDRYRAYAQQRRARLRGTAVGVVDEDALIVRDEGRCGICGGDLVPIPGRICFDVDHIVPLARGGTHEMANVRLAHPLCNRRKYTKVDYVPDAA